MISSLFDIEADKAQVKVRRVIDLDVQGEPVGQPRVRAFAKRLPNGQAIARVYTPGTAEAWKSAIAAAAREALPAEPMRGGVGLWVVFRFPRPRGHFGTGRNAAQLKSSSPLHHLGKPDVDNLVKAVMDVFTSIGVWLDDTLVRRAVVEKRWVVSGERPGASIRIAELEDES